MVQKLHQKDQLKFIALPNFFIHVFSIRVRITLVEHFSLFIEKDYYFNHVISLETGHAKPVFSLQIAGGTSMECLSVPDSEIAGENTKVTHTGKVGGAGKFPLILFFVFALSQFSGPDYLRAWNSL